MPLTITDEELARIELAPEQLRLEIAVMLRERDKMSYRAAAALAGLPVWDFKDVLAERGVPWIHVGGTTPEEALEYFGQEHGFLVDEDGRVSLDPAVYPTTPDGTLAPAPRPATPPADVQPDHAGTAERAAA